MHFEILVEDQSGKRALDLLMYKIVGADHTWNVRDFRGIGRIPKKLSSAKDATSRMLLDSLLRLLRGYGRTFAGYTNYAVAVVVVCDLDDKCLKTFSNSLLAILNACNPAPETRFCIAIEEGEAWLLGDLPAVRAAYPRAKASVLAEYVNDSICGTWEKMADALFSGGSASLSAQGWHAVGKEKSRWADNIAPNMDVEFNCSPSFCYFRDKVRGLIRSDGAGGCVD